MGKYDRDSNGVLELDEFRPLVEEIRSFQLHASKAYSTPTDEIHKMFLRYDTDNSGDIDVDELYRALNDLGLTISTSQAALAFDKYDTDRSKKLELDEFSAVLHALHVRFEVPPRLAFARRPCLARGSAAG